MKQSRRNFIKLSATAAGMLYSLDELAATDKPSFKQNEKFSLLLMATNWGFNGTIDHFWL